LLLLLRLTLVPVLIAAVTLASRRWGPRVGGFVTALPAIAGPTLGFYAAQQGNIFAAEAARGTLLGLIGVGAFALTYARLSAKLHWALCLIIGWVSFGAATRLIYRVETGPFVSLLLAVAALLGARALLPPPEYVPPSGPPPRWDLPMRMLSAAMLVFALTSAASQLGSSVSGVLTPFPVATAIIASFTHAQRGSAACVAFMRGFIPGLCTFAVFCFVLTMTLPSLTMVASFSAALVIQIAVLSVLLYLDA
jgi:hypothetical protein